MLGGVGARGRSMGSQKDWKVTKYTKSFGRDSSKVFTQRRKVSLPAPLPSPAEALAKAWLFLFLSPFLFLFSFLFLSPTPLSVLRSDYMA